MDTIRNRDARQLLSSECENLIKSINRVRIAAEAIKPENTEDEYDLATMSHDRELLYNLHQSDYTRLKSIQEAIKAIDSGRYGECVRCEEVINAKRLKAVPWTNLCIRCQEETEAERIPTRLVPAGLEADEPEL